MEPMKSVTETGHVRNIAQFKTMIEFVSSYGTAYNPSQPELQIANLEALLEDARTALSAVETANVAYFNKVHERQTAFADVRQLSSRLINAMANTDASVQTLNTAKALNRKMYGRRASSAPKKPIEPGAEAPKTISTSQQSFDHQIQHLSGIVSILKTIPSYNPNETEMQVPALEAKLVDLTRYNDEVAAEYAVVSNARIIRNKVLFGEDKSIHAVAMAVKRYIKTIYAPKSQEYKQISSLRFTKTYRR